MRSRPHRSGLPRLDEPNRCTARALEGNFYWPQKNGSIAEHHGRKVAGSEDKRDAHGDADDDPNGMESEAFSATSATAG